MEAIFIGGAGNFQIPPAILVSSRKRSSRLGDGKRRHGGLSGSPGRANPQAILGTGVESGHPVSGRYVALGSSFAAGPGIEPGVLEHIFEPFQQADSSTSRRYGGTGLGLTIASQLVELMGGSIEVKSSPGSGSTFSFQVPCDAGAEPSNFRSRVNGGARAQPASPDSRHQKVSSPASAKDVHVLLAEDDEINQLVAGQLLERAGCRV